MSLGNGNPKYGDKGSNFNYQHAVLSILRAILDKPGGSGPGGGDASAANQLSQISELQSLITSMAARATENTLSTVATQQTDGTQVSNIKANTDKNGAGVSYCPVVDSNGYLQVDVVSMSGGGDASAANQVLELQKLTDLSTEINNFASDNSTDLVALLAAVQGLATQNNTDLTNLISALNTFANQNNIDIVDVKAAIQTFDAQNGTDLAAILTALQNGDQLANIRSNTAKDGSGTALYPLLDTDGHLQVDILSGGGGGDASAANQLTEITKLTSIEADTSSLDSKIDKADTDDVTVTTSALPTGASTEAKQTELNDALSSNGGDQLRVDIISGAGSSDATAANQASMITELQQIEAELAGVLDVSMAATTVIPYILRETTSGSFSGARCFSIANIGAADADILGGTNNLKVGEVINFDAGLNNTYGAIAYDATGTELIITYNK